MSMMLDVIPNSVIPMEKRGSVDQMTLFIVLFHTRYFLQAILPVAGPRIDFQYWNDMCNFSRFDEVVVEEVKMSILRQQWYLTEELSILSLFGIGLSYSERTNVAKALLLCEKPQFFSPGKPSFPGVERLTNNSGLHEFVGSRSWLLFDLMNTKYDWLSQPSETWKENPSYQEMCAIINDLSVTNDTCERGVSKVTQYANSAQDGEQRDRIISAVSWQHNQMPGFSKTDLYQAH